MFIGKIYMHTCVVTGKSYIGQTVTTIKDRVRGKYSGKFKTILDLYGWEKITTSILEDKIHIIDISKREKFWIHFYNTKENGYNSNVGGGGGKRMDAYLLKSLNQSPKTGGLRKNWMIRPFTCVSKTGEFIGHFNSLGEIREKFGNHTINLSYGFKKVRRIARLYYVVDGHLSKEQFDTDYKNLL